MKHSREVRKDIRKSAAARADRDAVNLDSNKVENNEYVDKMNMNEIKNNDNMKPEANNAMAEWNPDTTKKIPDSSEINTHLGTASNIKSDERSTAEATATDGRQGHGKNSHRH